ncbi:phosphoglycolate phosphatase [Enterovibrio norvegicus FF-33]|uniref:Phosphoglycolate phosphatase n=1 Tax=Enterovibrio norvegicus FF-454 TaxID=1185651 RepID=A0A1E5CG60_9GAMM|nr:phosphoglycolate phosphatase [Enterovibrio norvegicus]OEE64459.1 phosphoglycolate phosphatase [Enterovibrio norvegicus FF-454]OEE68848.1 phosphoglycolate phosphatase [Enterovibrio norvegicus FF-33]
MTATFETIKYIAFDLDGTLVDSAPDLAEGIRMALADLNLHTVTDNDVRGWIGNGAEIMLKRALSQSVNINPELDEALYQKIRARFDFHYANNGHDKTVVYPGVKDTLSALKEAGYTMGIVTNKPYQFVPEILEDLGLAHYFSDVIGGDSLPTNKPDPEGLVSLRDKHGLSDVQMMMVGDSKNDILAAKNAGIISVGLTYGYNYGEPISDSAPEFVADQFNQLLTVLSTEKTA